MPLPRRALMTTTDAPMPPSLPKAGLDAIIEARDVAKTYRTDDVVVVPCHRVVGANGSLTGFGGGIDRKRWLLEHEGAAFVT